MGLPLNKEFPFMPVDGDFGTPKIGLGAAPLGLSLLEA